MKKHSLGLFAIKLLASCAALHAADASSAATNRPLVGAIRLDDYTRSPHKTLTSLRVEASNELVLKLDL